MLLSGRMLRNLLMTKATIQMGIGTIPDAVLKGVLIIAKDLGVHTEMLSDGFIDLILNDVINNKYKGTHTK